MAYLPTSPPFKNENMEKKNDNPFIKELSGKELIEMGFRLDTNGYLISNTTVYQVNIGTNPWGIRQVRNLPNLQTP